MPEPYAFVTLEDAKLYLHITDPTRDAEVQGALEHASAIIFDYVDEQADETWDATTAPDVVQAATLRMLAHIWEHRGDDDAADETGARIWDAIDLLLRRTRDPVVK